MQVFETFSKWECKEEVDHQEGDAPQNASYFYMTTKNVLTMQQRRRVSNYEKHGASYQLLLLTYSHRLVHFLVAIFLALLYRNVQLCLFGTAVGVLGAEEDHWCFLIHGGHGQSA